MKKRKLLKITFLAVGLLLISGCSQMHKEQETNSEKDKEQLVLWSYFETQAQKQALDCLMRDFNQYQNQYEISWTYVPMTEFEQSLSSAYTENNLPDMAMVDNPDMPIMIQMGMFEDITEFVQEWKIPETYYSSIVETTRSGDRYYGLPVNCNNTALFYNKDMVEEAGVKIPQTWEELFDAAGVLTRNDCAGFLMCGIDGEQGAFQILSWLLAAGESTETLGGEATEAALEFLQSMLQAGYLTANCINLTQTDVAREFADGKVAIMQNGPWAIPLLENSGVNFGITPIPGAAMGRAVVGGENIGILKGKNLEGSLAFLKFCIKENKFVSFCEDSNVLPGNRESAAKMAENKENMRAFVEQMDLAITRTSILNWPTVGHELTGGLYDLIAGKRTVKQIAEDIQRANTGS